MARGRQTPRDRRGRTRIGTRLGLLLVVPLAGLVAVTAAQATTAVGQYRDAGRLRSQAEVATAANRLVDALQDERTALAADRATSAELRAEVERATREVLALRDRTEGADRELLDRALGRVEAAAALAANGAGGIVAVDGYSPSVASLLRLADRSLTSDAAVDAGPAAVAELLSSAEEVASRERGLLSALAAGQTLGPAQLRSVTELSVGQRLLAERAAAEAGRDLAPDIEQLVDELRAAASAREALFVADPAAAAVRPVDLSEWMEGADQRIEDLRELRDRATAAAVAAVDALATSSTRTLAVAGLALVATILVSLLSVRAATRAIARPLVELAARAEEVALSRLPDAVRAHQRGEGEAHLPRLRVAGATEVHEVAAAFNDVQDTALRLAGEQAVLRRNQSEALTNLGRRNQTLLGRQLDFISDLEKRETDPAFLEHLFRLDHLASRMRRNAESLLILAGSETPRRRRRPAPVAEVVRAAMSEVEDFERVRLGDLGEATLSGPVVIDLVHLVAELVENALNFSPPSSTVEVEGRTLGQGGYQLAVVDHGVGMSDVELQAANQRMSGHDESVGVPTRYLGQYVIARLATKTGAMVRVQPTVGGRGVTAVVTLPASAMVGSPDRSSVARPLPGSRAAREQGPAPVAPGAGLVRSQPEPVVDPDADPFAEPVPASFGTGPVADAAAPFAEPVPASFGTGPGVDAAVPFDLQFDPSVPFDAPPAFQPASSSVPPPAPSTVPVQEGWTPGGAPEDPVRPEEVLAPYAGADHPEPGAGGSRLARRVPGASLARSPLGSGGPTPTPTAERSADGVRSMLSALQSGRSRGRGDGRSAGEVPGGHEGTQQGPTAPGWEESR